MDRQYRISVAKKRYDKIWQNRTYTLNHLREKLRNPVVTGETMLQYKSLSKELQTDTKDVGGFVGGYLEGGKRKNGCVKFRSLITLDFDDFDRAHLEEINAKLIFFWMMHSTHKHTPEAWRVRIIIPTDRDMTVDEYGAVARRIAEQCGFDGIDRSTFEPARLMFWPSCPVDAPYLYEESDYENLLEVDKVLATYEDWSDISEWPLLPCEQNITENPGTRSTQEILEQMARAMGGGGRMADPMEKEGVIGAFCHVYDVPTAINEFLSHIYLKGKGNRYTYVGSSTHGGAVVMDNGNFLYSFHSTDPLNGKCVNAFDLVRLHLFGKLDMGTKPDTRTTRLPSFIAMRDMALLCPKVKEYMIEARVKKATEDFEGMMDGEGEPSPAKQNETGDSQVETQWREILGTLDMNKDGSLKTTINNVSKIILYSPQLCKKLRYNAFTMRVEVFGEMPWKRDTTNRNWNNADESCLREYLETRYGISGKEKVADGFISATNENMFHPVRDYFNGLEWDGVKRLERVFPDILGADDTPLNRELFRLICVGAVKRIYEPGCKFDYFVILCGPEGSGKSTLFRIMGGEWFSDSVNTFEGKEGMEQIQGVLIIESGELTSYKRTDMNAVKAFISRQVDIFRPAYGRVKEVRPRQCIMVGTTNEREFLRGIDTGNRRSPVVDVKPELRKEGISLLEWMERNRDQLWAEAVVAYREGYQVWLDADLEREAKITQEAHNLDLQNSIFGEVERYLDCLIGDAWDTFPIETRISWLRDPEHYEEAPSFANWNKRDYVTVPEILQEGLVMDKTSKEYRTLGREIGQYLNRHPDWELIGNKRTRLYGVQKTWKRKNPDFPVTDLTDL